MSLVLDLSDFEREVGEKLDFELSSDEPGPRTGPETEFGPVRVSGRALWTGETVLVEGRALTEARFTCSRCLGPFNSELSAEFVQEFRPVGASSSLSEPGEAGHPGGEPPGGEPEGAGAGDEAIPFHGGEIDLTELVWEALVLEVPMKPVCRENCRGLCPVCGGNLNETECGCRAEETDPRLLPLKKLLEAQERSE